MNSLVRRLRTLPLRSRLALLVAVAVAAAVAAVAVTCWFITRDQLYAQLDNNLRTEATSIKPSQLQFILATCNSEAAAGSQGFPGPTVQIVQSDGSVCTSPGDSKIPVQSADVAVAAGTSTSAEHTTENEDGTAMRVVTLPAVDQDRNRLPQAVSIASPLHEVTKPLTTLAWTLLFVGGIGVIGATAAGLWIARTGLRPVDQLTETVEHVARTEDLTVRIPVEGNDEIARLSESFNSMTASLASSRELQQQLIADAGHELRTPLTSMRTNIELLTRSEETGRAIPPDDRRALMASLKAQMTELAALIGDLQELSRSGLSGSEGPLKVVSFHETARAALERARLRGPELKIVSELAPWYVRAEPAALERAIINLLDNAVKFSPRGATVEVRLMRGVLTVRDHGPGIPADELPHVFDRFWRSPTARALPGSGLGLSIVARTVESYGGEVALAAADGGGTVATMRLPGAPTPTPDLEP
ncbi:cell wall metabolism sensor histidine kinase WalK [Streptomyces sp. VRA16 Mangrove soil]|uniref:sensor histidine kinase n=1 Tax=Streptomyces sp. VRA16 Mangrove soil TaxID=2817434 RepID=UPI001A9D987C|nr:HAMP domain-containing sensor histidine kinase [Streptomyces sp. VRA16 Mangrove soil]MBO1337516.1 HAMP domain-containing histidine kinase [Streptomyces sp. VRA16 Mangrove soil]